jgi:hypothetical protein
MPVRHAGVVLDQAPAAQAGEVEQIMQMVNEFGTSAAALHVTIDPMSRTALKLDIGSRFKAIRTSVAQLVADRDERLTLELSGRLAELVDEARDKRDAALSDLDEANAQIEQTELALIEERSLHVAAMGRAATFASQMVAARAEVDRMREVVDAARAYATACDANDASAHSGVFGGSDTAKKVVRESAALRIAVRQLEQEETG